MEEPVEHLQKIRINISSRSLKCINKVSAEIVGVAEGMHLTVWGPAKAPTVIRNIRTRFAPSRDGTNLYGNEELRVYKRYIDLLSSHEVVKQIISVNNVVGVKIEVTVVDLAI